MAVDPVGGFDSFSMNSMLSTSTVSIMEPPSRLESEYYPLREIYASHSEPLPLKRPGIKDSNSEALIQALQSLQLKIKHLEQGRVEAADHFKQLSKETLRKQQEVDSNEENTPPSLIQSPPVYVDHNFDCRLTSLDTRFALQAKELELLRERLRQAENDREEALRKNKELEYVQEDSHTPKKMEELERAQTRLRASNVMTNTKLRELEGQLLRQQRDKRRSKRSSGDPTEITVDIAERTRRKKKSSQTTPLSCSKPVPGIHYHLNMRDVPFVVGTSTGPSHSVSANYQKVVSLMKYHNPLLCGAAAENVKKGVAKPKKTTKRKEVTPPTGASYDELKGLLKAIEEEFGALAFQHQDLSKAIQQQQQQYDDDNGSLQLEELQTELAEIVQQLENKMEQIELIKKLLKSAKRSDHTHHKGGKRGQQSVYTTVPRHGEVKVVTTVKAKKRGPSCPLRTSSSSSVGSHGNRTELDCNRGLRPCSKGSPDSLQVLKGMKKLQNTLQRDDLSWT